jgi:hypothetical protein
MNGYINGYVEGLKQEAAELEVAYWKKKLETANYELYVMKFHSGILDACQPEEEVIE